MKKRGFTLIELLVVIAIIAILAAILFPVFSRVRAKAQQTQCMSNLKQIGTATNMYMSDWDGAVPPQSFYGRNVLFPYLQSTQVFTCPSSPQAELIGCDYGPPTWGWTSDYLKHYIYSSYARNEIGSNAGAWGARDAVNAAGKWPTGVWPAYDAAWVSTNCHSGYSFSGNSGCSFVRLPTRSKDIADPAGSIEYTEVMYLGSSWYPNSGLYIVGDMSLDYAGFYGVYTSGSNKPCVPPDRHNGGFNACYGDGHVKWLRYGTTKPGDWTIQSGD